VLKGFRDFLMRGNVVDLAVAVVIGTSFTAVVNAFAKDFIGSVIGKFGHEPNFDNFAPGGFKIGTTITALISFLIVAAAVYFIVVVPSNRINAYVHRNDTDKPATVPEDIALLKEIRDLLAEQRPTRA
jgi:large conductance mechanosensitive channel